MQEFGHEFARPEHADAEAAMVVSADRGRLCWAAALIAEYGDAPPALGCTPDRGRRDDRDSVRGPTLSASRRALHELRVAAPPMIAPQFLSWVVVANATNC